jgi:hypothetical protein
MTCDPAPFSGLKWGSHEGGRTKTGAAAVLGVVDVHFQVVEVEVEVEMERPLNRLGAGVISKLGSLGRMAVRAIRLAELRIELQHH